MQIRVKRIYDQPASTDGYRVLVDHIWPRGVSKAEAHLDKWLKEIAPSDELRKWYGHKPELFSEFSKRYKKELNANKEAVSTLREIIKKHPTVTLLYATKASDISNAAVLLEYLKDA